MNGPDIVAVESLSGRLAHRLPALGQAPGLRHFVVVRSGVTVQGSFDADEVIVCSDSVSDGDTVVLVPRGWGNPQIGSILGRHLEGEAGEPCHPGRWQVAGRVAAVWRLRKGSWVCQLNERSGTEPAQASLPMAEGVAVAGILSESAESTQSQQLALFAA